MRPSLPLKVATTTLLLANSLYLLAQDPGSPKAAAHVTFKFERPGLEVPRFSLSVSEDGTGRYEADVVFPSARGSEAAPAPQQVERKIVLSRSITLQIFAATRELDRFNAPCESKAKNIADTGKKTLQYAGDDGEGTCVYNYSEDKRVAMLTDTFLGIALTLDIGRKLEFDHRFDRLGLDAVTDRLATEVEAGRAIEVGTIAPTLRSIAQDSEVLERVRARAAKLLLQTPPAS